YPYKSDPKSSRRQYLELIPPSYSPGMGHEMMISRHPAGTDGGGGGGAAAGIVTHVSNASLMVPSQARTATTATSLPRLPMTRPPMMDEHVRLSLCILIQTYHLFAKNQYEILINP